MLFPPCHCPFAICTLLSGLGDDGRRSVKASGQTFIPSLPKAARSLPILHRVLVLPPLSFDEFIRHQIQALDFCYFWAKPKVKALRQLAEVSQGVGKMVNEPTNHGVVIANVLKT